MTDIKGKAKQEDSQDPLFDDIEFEKILNQEASLLSRESEVPPPSLSLHCLAHNMPVLGTTSIGMLQIESIRDIRVELDARFWNH